MHSKGVVFVTGDRLGDHVTTLLEEAGCQVIRGPQPHPLALTTFPREEWPRLFSETDVIVASPRDIEELVREEDAQPALRGVGDRFALALLGT